MRAAVLHGKQELRVERVPVPKIGPSDVLVKVRVALTCGTDLKVFRRGYHARMLRPPTVLGHEQAGDVVAVGSCVQGFQVGQRVVAANSAPCRNCYFCRHRQENLCEDLLFNNGAYAEYIRIPERIVKHNAYTIPTGIGYRDAAMAEPVACVLRGLEEVNLQPGEVVAVIGLGPIGLMFVRLAKLSGARVIAVGRRRIQLDRARILGADDLVAAKQRCNLAPLVRNLTEDRRGCDVVIEAAGTPETWQRAIEVVQPGGRVNFFGGCASGTCIDLNASRVHYSEITLKSTFHHTPRHIRAALDLIRRGDLSSDEFVSGVAHLSDVPRVFEAMMRRNGHLKTAILP